MSFLFHLCLCYTGFYFVSSFLNAFVLVGGDVDFPRIFRRSPTPQSSSLFLRILVYLSILFVQKLSFLLCSNFSNIYRELSFFDLIYCIYLDSPVTSTTRHILIFFDKLNV